jgi:hypothetical protein
MRDAQLLVWMGDFNYRVDTTYEEAKEAVRRKALESLLEKVIALPDRLRFNPQPCHLKTQVQPFCR